MWSLDQAFTHSVCWISYRVTSHVCCPWYIALIALDRHLIYEKLKCTVLGKYWPTFHIM